MATKPRVVLLHGTPVAVEPIQRSFAARWPEAELVNLLDEFPLGRQGQGSRSHRTHVRALYRARRLCAPPRRRRHSRHLLGVRPGHRTHDGRVADTGSQAQRCDVSRRHDQGQQDRHARNLRAVGGDDDAGVRRVRARERIEGDARDHRRGRGHGCPAQGRCRDAQRARRRTSARSGGLRCRDARPLLDVACRRRCRQGDLAARV